MHAKYKKDLKIPDDVNFICSSLNKANESSYLVGGGVRDFLLGKNPSDWDLATTATPKKTIKLFDKVIPTGIAHGTVTILIGKKSYEITTLRGEGAYSDGRHPDDIVFLNDIIADLERRDFTINAMAWEPNTQILHDPFNGEADLQKQIIRAVGCPKTRFEEDGLRLIRAARFCSTLEFTIEKDTLLAMKQTGKVLTKVSAERKRDELQKILMSRLPSLGLQVLAVSNLLQYICPNLATLANNKKSNQWNNTLSRVDFINAKMHLRLAALLFDTKTHFDKGISLKKWLAKMRFDKKNQNTVAHLLNVAHFNVDEIITDTHVRQLMQLIKKPNIEDLLLLKTTDFNAKKELNLKFENLISKINTKNFQNAPLSISELNIDGKVIIDKLNIKSGSKVGYILKKLLNHVIKNPTDNNQSTLLDIARTIVDLAV